MTYKNQKAQEFTLLYKVVLHKQILRVTLAAIHTSHDHVGTKLQLLSQSSWLKVENKRKKSDCVSGIATY